jgi:membrane-associated phospholipid phosphatase
VFGSIIPLTGLALFIALLAWTLTQHWWRGVAACAAAPIAIAVTEQALKPLVDRRVPRSATLFYPSGHLTGVGAMTSLVVILVMPRLARAELRVPLVAICAVACCTGLLATVASHAHGPLDAAAGLATGTSITIAWVLLLDTFLDTVQRRRNHETVP